MNILYIIGNGLDISYGMKTSYQDFFSHYLKLSSDDDVILAMKKDIESKRFKTWADLEIGLGIYSSKCENKEAFLKCLADIRGRLKDYLVNEYQIIKQRQIQSRKGFLNPGIFLDPEPLTRYNAYKSIIRASDTRIDVITLNYTTTLEHLFDYKGIPLIISPSENLNSINHVHGTLDNMMVMGVNDSSQIDNLNFNMDIDIMEEFIKPEFNDACMNNKNSICESIIKKSDMIVLYGTSLGKSDDKWWKFIGKRMDTDEYPLLIYLPYDENKNQSAEPNHLRRWTRGYIREIRDKFDIKIDEEILSRRVCVALNKQLLPISRVLKQTTQTK